MRGWGFAGGTAVCAMMLLLLGCGGRSPRERQHAMMTGGTPMQRTSQPGPGMKPAAETGAAPVVPAGGGAAAAPPPGCPPVSPEVVAAGRQIFNRGGNCFSCHGPSGSGTGMAPTLHAHRWLKIDGSYASIVGLVNAGVPHPVGPFTERMPAKGGADLTSTQVCSVAAYVFALSHS